MPDRTPEQEKRDLVEWFEACDFAAYTLPELRAAYEALVSSPAEEVEAATLVEESALDIELCSLALVKIGAARIRSFDDGTFEAEYARRLYPLVRDALLCSYPWSFAVRLVNATGNRYVPGTVLKVLDRSAVDGQRRWTQTAADVQCIGRVSESEFPPYFTNALIARLAAEFCLPLTENGSRSERLARLAEDEVKLARLVDSQRDKGE